MAAGHDDDARRTLAELEAKLRELERELLRDREPGAPGVSESQQQPAAPEPPPPAAPEPVAGEPAAERPAPEPTPEAEAFPEPSVPDAPLAAEAFPEPSVPDAPFAAEPAPAEPDDLTEPTVPDTPYTDPLAAEAQPLAAAEPEPSPEDARPDPLAAADPEAFPDPAPLAPSDADEAPLDALAAEAGPPADAFLAEPPPPPEPPPPALDLDALADAHEVLDELRSTIDQMGVAADRITIAARAVVDDHGRSLARLELAARAAARAEEAAAEAGRVASTIVIEAGPFADPGPLLELRDALAARPGTKDAYVRGVEDGRAVIEVHLAPPPP